MVTLKVICQGFKTFQMLFSHFLHPLFLNGIWFFLEFFSLVLKNPKKLLGINIKYDYDN